MISILVKRYAIVVLTFISLMATDVVQLFLCFFGYLYIFFAKMFIQIFYPFLIGLSFCIELEKIFI